MQRNLPIKPLLIGLFVIFVIADLLVLWLWQQVSKAPAEAKAAPTAAPTVEVLFVADTPAPVFPEPTPAPALQPAEVYTVQKGDTMYTIAKRNNVSLLDLVFVNHIVDPWWIWPGQKLVIPLPGTDYQSYNPE